MNWTSTRKRATNMWTIIFGRFRNYIWMKKQRRKKEKWKMRK